MEMIKHVIHGIRLDIYNLRGFYVTVGISDQTGEFDIVTYQLCREQFITPHEKFPCCFTTSQR